MSWIDGIRRKPTSPDYHFLIDWLHIITKVGLICYKPVRGKGQRGSENKQAGQKRECDQVCFRCYFTNQKALWLKRSDAFTHEIQTICVGYC